MISRSASRGRDLARGRSSERVALTLVHEALAVVDKTGECWPQAELHLEDGGDGSLESRA
jgi:hypothetical protein